MSRIRSNADTRCPSGANLFIRSSVTANGGPFNHPRVSPFPSPAPGLDAPKKTLTAQWIRLWFKHMRTFDGEFVASGNWRLLVKSDRTRGASLTRIARLQCLRAKVGMPIRIPMTSGQRVGIFIGLLAAALVGGCTPGADDPTASDAEAELAAALADPEIYFCPMDLDVRSNEAGFCPRCRMALVAGLPDPADYNMDLTLTPNVPQAGGTTTMGFSVRDPWEDHPVHDFEVMHEKFFHLFVMSQDLEFFQHIHPIQDPQKENFFVDVVLPKPGLYQVLADFYPVGGTPQLIAKSFIVPGGRLEAVELDADYTSPIQGENLQVELVTEPAVPLAGQETEMYFTVTPAEGLEEYIGAWGHMLAVSDDLIDTVHGHPFIADGGPEMLFHLTFPRTRTYRVWMQFQRNSVVNTVHFDIPVEELTF